MIDKLLEWVRTGKMTDAERLEDVRKRVEAMKTRVVSLEAEEELRKEGRAAAAKLKKLTAGRSISVFNIILLGGGVIVLIVMLRGCLG